MSQAELGGIYRNLAARGPAPQVDVQATLEIGGGCIKVVAAVSSVSCEADFAAAIETATEGAGRVVPGSFRMSGRVAVAVVAANARSRPMDAAFTMVTASTAVDSTGTIWRVENVGGQKRVVLESSDDLSAIFRDRVARRSVHLNPVEGRGIATAAVASGDLVRYVDVAKSRTHVGVALIGPKSEMQVVRTDGRVQMIAQDAVVESVPRARLPREISSAPIPATAKLSPDQFDKITSYLSKAYGPASGPMLERLRKLAGAAA